MIIGNKCRGIMAGNDKKIRGKHTHVSDGLGEISTQICSKVTPPVSQKLRSTSRSHSLNLKQVPLIKEEINRDESTVIDKSPRKKRGSLKMNKSNKPRVSPYATRSLLPFGFLRSGRSKFDINMLQLKPKCYKKRIIPDDVKPMSVGDSKTNVKLRKSPSPLLGPKEIRRHMSEEPIATQTTNNCSINSNSMESIISLANVKDELSDDKVSVIDITFDSLSGGTQVIPEDMSEENLNSFESSIEEGPSMCVTDLSNDKSSSLKILSDLKEGHSETDLIISCNDDLLSKKEEHDSCDMVFDMSKCGNCLQPVIVGAKVKGNVTDLISASEESFSEKLCLSESPISFGREREHFNDISKSDFELDRCTLDASSGILSTENSESSVLRCSSADGTFYNSTSLPHNVTEEESESATPTNSSISLPTAEDKLMENIRTVERHAKQDLVHLESDSTHAATNALEIHVQTDAVVDEFSESDSVQEVKDSSANVMAVENEKMEPAKDLAADAAVSILEPSEKCSSNSSFSPNRNLSENDSKPLIDVEDPADIYCVNNSTRSIELDRCDILSREDELCSKSVIDESPNTSKCRSNEENFDLQFSIRTSLADIVKKGLLNLPEPETATSIKEAPVSEEPGEELITLTDSDSSTAALDKCDETKEIPSDGETEFEKSCHNLQQSEPVENEKVSEEMEIVECQKNESISASDQTVEEKVTDYSTSASICMSEHHQENMTNATDSPDEVNCNQKENEDMENSLEVENDVKASSTETAVDIIEDSAEQLAIKETILNALGLQSSRAASLAKSTVRQVLPPIPSRTSGTLKTIIKVPRMTDKRRARNRVKLVLKSEKSATEKDKGSHVHDRRYVAEGEEACEPRQPESMSLEHQTTQDPLSYRIFNESCMSTIEPWSTHVENQKTEGNGSKFSANDPISDIDLNRLYFSKSSINGLSSSTSMDCQSKSNQDLDQNVTSDGSSNSGRSSQQGSSEGSGEASLVIPEKSASFSIHPERLCHDVCCYCFGKFGSLDTPMHVAQMKGEDKRRAALALETHLSLDACLCDACYRYLDRKASCPSYQPYRRQSGVSGGILTKPQVCCVRGCSLPAHHLVRRKWLTRLRRTISKLLPLELTPVPSHQQQPLHAPLCSRHFYCLEYYSLCGICKRKLSRNNMHPVGREVHALNSVLLDDSIPVTLTGKIFLCKMCRYYSGIRLKYRDKSMLSSGHKTFFDGYRKRIWHYLGIQTLDSSEISAPMEIPKKRKKSKSTEGDSSKISEQCKNPKRTEGPSSQPVETTSESSSETSTYKPSGSAMPTKIRFKLGNVSIGQLDNIDLNKKDSKGQIPQTVTHSGPQRKSESSKPKKKSAAAVGAVNKTCFPGVEQLGLNASFVFHGNGNEKNKEWEKCTTTIQFDSKTKKLWQSLYYPYGNFSSFIRHLVIMERNWRNGDLVLAPNASSQAVNYVNSVQNRIAAYEGSSSHMTTKSTLPKPSSSKPAPSKPVSVPHKATKEPPQLLPVTTVPRISLTNAQLSQCSPNVTAPVTAQLIPINPMTNFLPINCGPSQFISIGSTSSFIQVGGATGLVHQINSAYPCVRFNQEVVPEKNLLQKSVEISEQELPVVSAPLSSSSDAFDLHISNVRSLADDIGNTNCWEQQPEKQLPTGEDLIASDTYSSDKPEEQRINSVSVVPVAPPAVVSTPPVEISDNHAYSDETVGNQSTEESVETQGNIFKTV